MRALLVGVGGAGCRIVETLNLHDLKSGVNSVRSYFFDSDREFINSISGADADHKVVLTPTDPIKNTNDKGTDFDVSNIVDCFQDYQVDNIDAVFVCAGLGGRMAEAVPSIIKQLKDAFPDPVFAILTLPGRNEGVKISSRASVTLSDIRRFASASIIFDNETWSQRIESGSIDKTGLTKKQSISEDYPMLNELLSRQISLLFRAGEFTDEGVDSAEVVLDAGEVLNTLKGMDLVAIGFALEKLPSSWNGFMRKIKLEKYLLEEGHLKTSRIVDLAKKAVYEEVSVPCDLTSANKALVLISGPSEELSMKGFQTVRKWIDRSIRGLEMRAGDYPVQSTKYVGVIIVLAGIENVPRITELDEIKNVYEEEQKKVYENSDISEIDVPHIPLLTVAKDEVIFEREMAVPIRPLVGIDEAPEEYFEEKKMTDTDDDFFENEKSAQEKKPVREANDDDFFEIGDLPETKKSVSEISDDDFFEDGKTVKSPQTENNFSKTFDESNDDFFDDGEIRKSQPPKSNYSEPSENFFEDSPVNIPKTPTPSYNTGSIFDEPVAPPKRVYESPVNKPASKPKYEKINVCAPKKLEKNDTVIQLPKRDKKEDGVLVGMANIGGNDKPKDTIGVNLTNVGERKRPKETESSILDGYISAGNSKRPKDSDSRLSIGGTIRPKETDGHIRLSGAQRPKETDGIVRMSPSSRPKETDGIIKVSSYTRPKETDSGIPVEGAKRPKELNRPIRVTSIPLPKNLEGKNVEKKKI